MTETFEASLQQMETRIAAAERQAKAVLSRLSRARRNATLGDINAMVGHIAQAPDDAERLSRALTELSGSAPFDIAQSMSDGSYVQELQAEAARQGVTIMDRDGRLSAFPFLLKLEPRLPAVRIGRKALRAIRPSYLVRSLKAAQQGAKFNASGFLEQILRAYQHLASSWTPSNTADGPVVSLSRIHALLTLLPMAAAEYPREAFACDLLRLNRAPDIRTKDGFGFAFAAATGSKGPERITAYDEDGTQHIFVGVQFLLPENS